LPDDKVNPLAVNEDYYLELKERSDVHQSCENDEDVAYVTKQLKHAIALSKIISALTLVHSYAGTTDEWMIIKKELLKALPWELRTLFSTRGQNAEIQLNDFEMQLAKRWTEMTGRPVLFR